MSANQAGRREARLTLALVMCAALPAQACWDEAAARYQVNSALLYAIAQTERLCNGAGDAARPVLAQSAQTTSA